MTVGAKNSASSPSDPVIEFVRNASIQEPKIVRAYLFGSRARGDYHPRSDYDFAIEAPDFQEFNDIMWNQWSLDLQEKAPTLCGLDLIRLGPNTSPSLMEAIRNEGILIYERKHSG